MASSSTSPRTTSPRAPVDEDEFFPPSPTEYKRFSSVLTDANTISNADDTKCDLQVSQGKRPKKTAQELRNQPTCCKCIRSWWRRLVFVLIDVGGIITGVVFLILKLVKKTNASNDSSNSSGDWSSQNLALSAGRIADGTSPYHDSIDATVGVNPLKYPTQACKLPQYSSTDGKIYVEGPNGERIPIAIKGITWSGMESGHAIPYGLWHNDVNGTTVYQVAAFLARNNFNSVRLPLCIENLLSNRKPNQELINSFANKAINLENYMTALSSLIQAFAYRKISVLLDLHSLTPTDAGGSWVGETISELSYLAAVDVLTSKLCNDLHWNVLGLDLKNEPYTATWGDGVVNDWKIGAQKIANRMLAGCPNWLAFVQGTVASRTLRTDDNQVLSYTDWWGGGLQNEAKYPLTFNVPNKLVYAPHYYTPAEYPQAYFVRGGLRDHELMVGFVEFENKTLQKRIQATTNDMFGYLAQYQQGAIVLGEFGGLYTQDRFANLTQQRTIEFTMDVALQPGFAGGYVYNFNPETPFEYNPSNYKGLWKEGVVQDDWVHANIPYLKALEKMNSLLNLKMHPEESLEAPVQYARFQSNLLDEDEEMKQEEKDEKPMSLQVEEVTQEKRGCIKTKRGKAILIACVLGLIGIIVGLVVANNASSSSNATANASNPSAESQVATTTTAQPTTPSSQVSTLTPTTTNVQPTNPPQVTEVQSTLTTSTITPTPLSTPSSTLTPTLPSTSPRTPTPTTTTALPTTIPPPPPIYGKITDGTPGTTSEEITNPLAFPTAGCKLPNYVSESGRILARASNGSDIPIAIKGINWFGMETDQKIPFGLWANPENGTSIYEIVSFLSRHRFNSIRLPLSVDHIIKNSPPNEHLVNQYQSPSLNLTTYLSTIGSLIEAFGSKGISILLDIHYLTPSDTGDAWFSDQVPEQETLHAIDLLASSFCSDQFWNVIGIDLKNEPWNTTWGDGGPKDMRIGAATLGNRMLSKCPQWLAFVEGNARSHTIKIKNQTFEYYDWWGGGLQSSGLYPLTLNIPSKIVWAPHYYSPSVYPQSFLVKGAMARGPNESTLKEYSEWNDEELREIVQTTAEDMFGYLRKVQGGAIVFGEFGGLYALDAHPNKTSQRVIEDCMHIMKEQGYAGGYMWALNPEGGYAYNPSSTSGYWEEGLLKHDWHNVNMEYLKALEILDEMPNLHSFPCFK